MNTQTEIAASLRALVSRSVDYAGLFPPASLALEPSLQNYADYVGSDDAWMLGAFVLPFSQFDAAAEHLNRFNVEHTLRISALGPKTDYPRDFLSALRAGVAKIRDFRERHGAIVAIEQIEIALPAQPGVTLTEAIDTVAELRVPLFLEAPPDHAERVIATLVEHRAAAENVSVGFKLRTGGVVASAFPSSVQIARALGAVVQHRVPIKFTAGLHHPVRLFHSSVQTKMHGFLNVLGAGVFALEHGWNPQQIAAMLDDEDAASFRFDNDEFSWRDMKISAAAIREHRQLITSFGSCSFDEPREDLRALGLL